MIRQAATLFLVSLLVACSGGDTPGTSPASHEQTRHRLTPSHSLLHRHGAEPRRTQKAIAADYQVAVQELYIAYFGRPADPTGLANFEAALLAAGAPTDIAGLATAYATNPGVQSLINSFGTSAESVALYGNGNTTAFVSAVFQNVLGRQPAAAGLNFWVNAISSGSLTQGDAALSIMAGGLVNTTPQGLLDAQLINNRIAASTYFSAQLSAMGDISAYSGKTAAAAARTMLNGVGSSTTSTSYQSAIGSVITSLVASGSLSGIAATGAPLQNATVTLKDAAGNVKTAQTGSDGSFQFSMSGLTAPFLLKVVAGSGALYSYAGPSYGTANLNVYTTVVLQSYYQAQGSDLATSFNGTLSSAAGFPSVSQVAALSAPVVTSLQPYLGNAEVANSTQFNPFVARFSANGTGFDQVLDRTAINAGLNSYTVDNGSGSTAGTLSSTVTLDVTAAGSTAGALASVSVTSQTTVGNVTSSSQLTVPVATSTSQQTDLEAAQSGVLALFQTLRQLSGSSTSVPISSVLPYVDPAFLDEGRDQASFAGDIVQELTSVLPSATVSIYRVNQFTDGSTKYLDVTVELQTPDGQINFLDDNDNVNMGMVFKQSPGGGWVFYGRQTIAEASVALQQQRCYGCAPQETDALSMQAQVNALTGTISSVTVSGPTNSLPDCTKNPSPVTLSSVTLVKDSGTYNGGDRFDLACSQSDGGVITGNIPPAGTKYTFALKPPSGATTQSTYVLNAATNDNGDIGTINGIARGTFVGNNNSKQVAGSTLTINYTLPTTYPVLYSFLSAFCANANELGNGLGNGGGEDIQGTQGNIPPGTTSGTISIPATCDGAPTAGVALNVWFVGVNGELSLVAQNFATN